MKTQVEQEIEAAKTSADGGQYKWTVDEIGALLNAHPQNAFFRYALDRLSPQSTKFDPRFGSEGPPRRPDHRADLSLLSLFSGVTAIEESLQLGEMRNGFEPRIAAQRATVDVETLVGPTAKSHPWAEMMAAKNPVGKSVELSKLCQLVPPDFLFVECKTLSCLIETIESIGSWGQTITNQLRKTATGNQLSKRLIRQLALEREVVRSNFNGALYEVALTSSDLFAIEGSDVTLLFTSEEPDRLKQYVAEAISQTSNEHDVSRDDLLHGKTAIVRLYTDSLDINAFYAEPTPGIQLRSNCLTAIESVIDSVLSGDTGLGCSDEFKYVRTLMPRNSGEEDIFIYLSAPFIRRLVGPQLRLTERRRVSCHANLKLLDHACMLHATQNGVVAKEIRELIDAGSAPTEFSWRNYSCPEGGVYGLSARDGLSIGRCSRHGVSDQMTPCLEIPVTLVSDMEAKEYNTFLEGYNQYWLTYFDPIAMRVKVTDSCYKVETIVLPLIDNSIYTELSTVLGGKINALETVPVPKTNIFTAAINFDKQALLSSAKTASSAQMLTPLLQGIADKEIEKLDFLGFLERILGDQISLNVCDSLPAFTLDVSGLMALMSSSMGAMAGPLTRQFWWVGFVVASLNAPVYAAAPVNDTEATDRFLQRLYQFMRFTSRSNLPLASLIGSEFYKFDLDADRLLCSPGYCIAVQVGPVKLRFYWARIANAIYVTSKESVLRELMAANQIGAENCDCTKYDDQCAPGHAMVRFRCANWNNVVEDISISQAETNRNACVKNIVALSVVQRAALALSANGLSAESEGLDTGDLFCAESGIYSSAGNIVCCSVHGTAKDPIQPARSRTIDFTRDAEAITAQLRFLEDGLHASLTIDRSHANRSRL